MEFLARLYVNNLEPALKVGAFLIMVFLILQAWSLLRDGKKLGDVISAAFMLLIKIVTGSIKFIGKTLYVSVVVLQKSLNQLVKAISDFFNSKI